MRLTWGFLYYYKFFTQTNQQIRRISVNSFDFNHEVMFWQFLKVAINEPTTWY